MVFSYLPIIQEHNGMYNYNVTESSCSVSGLPLPAYFVGVQYYVILHSIHILFFFSFHTQQSLLFSGSQRYLSESASQLKVC
jgi:hypothetical protein